MRKRKQQVIMEENVRYFDPIPVDLINNILSRFSVKPIAQCRCVSKLWSSIIRRQNYNQLFPIKPPNPPLRFLFTFLVEKKKLVFFSSPQPQNPDNHLSLVATRHHTNSDVTELVYKLCRPIGGLVCCQHIGKNYILVVISNPITGEYVTLPKLMMKEDIESYAECYFGYDPIEKQFKVLCVIWFFCPTYDNWCIQHHILTLTENLLWREIQCCKPYVFLNSLDGICINGVLYYTAKAKTKHDKRMIVSFDVSTEKFGFIDIDKDLATKIHRDLVMINYKGKLGVYVEGGRYDDPFELWVLEDAKEHKWSKLVYNTTLHREVLNSTSINSAGVIGVTDSGDIVLCQKYALENHFNISYYNLESKVMVRVRVDIPEFNALKSLRFYAFPNYVEDVKLI